jgi:hypothetical protein
MSTALLTSCDIEKSAVDAKGSVSVSASTPSGDPIIGAAISIDGVAQYQSTPVISNPT